MKRIFILVIFALFCSVPLAMAVVSLPFSDDFEDYTVGEEPPSPWFTLVAGKGTVTTVEAHSGTKSVVFSGGPYWSQTCLVDLGENYPDKIGYEAWVKVNSQGSGIYVGYFEQIQNMAPQFNAVLFHWNGNVYFIGQGQVLLQENYSLGVWHKVRIEIDYASLKANVWIDDNFVGDQITVLPKNTTWELYGQIYPIQLRKVGVEHINGTQIYFDDFSVFEWISEIQVSVDIKPGSCPNPLRLPKVGSEIMGKLPVAILGTQDFDVTKIDPASIRLTREGVEGEVAPIRSAYGDAATPYDGELCGYQV